MRTAYLGPPGTFSHEVLLASDPNADGEPQPTVHDAVAAVAAGRAGRALVPIENSIEGGVTATLDALAFEFEDVAITGEVIHAISHCLVATGPLAGVSTVTSHPQALAQCARFLRDQLPGVAIVQAPSTAEAVRTAAADPSVAAIGTRTAAGMYGCDVIAEGIEDEPGNQTRFVWVMRDGAAPDAAGGATKTSLVWWGSGDEAPGWLVRCLAGFAAREVNLTRIESRPRRLGLGHYMFFADLDGALSDGRVAEAVEALRGHAEVVRILGSYPAATGSPTGS